MFDFRYHVASLVAVIVMLGVGMLLGSAIGDRGALDRQRNELLASIRKDLTALEQTNDQLKADVARDRPFAAAAGEALTAQARCRGARSSSCSTRAATTGCPPSPPRSRRPAGTSRSPASRRRGLGLADDAALAGRIRATVDGSGTAGDLANAAGQGDRHGVDRGRRRLGAGHGALSGAGKLGIEDVATGTRLDGLVLMATWDGKTSPALVELARQASADGVAVVGVEPETRTAGVAEAGGGRGAVHRRRRRLAERRLLARGGPRGTRVRAVRHRIRRHAAVPADRAAQVAGPSRLRPSGRGRAGSNASRASVRRDVGELTPPVREPRGVAARVAVRHGRGHLDDGESGAQRPHRERRPPSRSRGRAAARRSSALGPSARWPESGASAGNAREPSAWMPHRASPFTRPKPPDPGGGRGTPAIAMSAVPSATASSRASICGGRGAQVRVEDQDRRPTRPAPRRRLGGRLPASRDAESPQAVLDGGGLAARLAADEDLGAGRLGLLGRVVGRPVVDHDDHALDPRDGAERRDRRGDRGGLVARGDDGRRAHAVTTCRA